ncbi:MAG TPA: NfeD family protein [Anseongella sp.]|nr:NfeD family protein [Anseongella sp.]
MSRILFFLFCLSWLPGFAQDSLRKGPPIVYQLDVRENIGPASLRKMRKAFEEASKVNASYLLVHMNTYGGLLDAADSMRTRLLKSGFKTIVYINNNAASAGALIALACDSIYMHPGGTIGAASVVNQTGEVMPEKYQSYMRSMMRATAEVQGRDPRIAEAFVDPAVEIPGIIASGKVLTFTSEEALKQGYCEGIAGTIDEALKMAGLEDYELIKPEITWTDRLIDFLINPMVSGILLMLILGGIYFEMQSPGIGFAIGVSVAAAVLYFMPLYIEGLAANWEILLFLVGVVLLAIEIFAIPGFGVAGILGIISMVCGLAFSLVLNDYFNFAISGGNIVNAFLLVLASIILTTVLAFMFGKNIFSSGMFKKLTLTDEQRSSEGYVGTERGDNLAGQTGRALTDLRPSGKIEVNGRRYDAVSEGDFLVKGTEIEVIKHETFSIFVRQKH